MKFLLPLLLLSIVALASAANESDIATATFGHAHSTMMTNANLSASMLPINSTANITANATTSRTPAEKAEHDQLVLELTDEKKRFNQTYLDCDVELKKMLQDVENAINVHAHEKGRKKLDELKVHQVDLTKNPCDPANQPKLAKDAKKNNTMDKDDKSGKSEAQSVKFSWGTLLVSLVMMTFGGR